MMRLCLVLLLAPVKCCFSVTVRKYHAESVDAAVWDSNVLETITPVRNLMLCSSRCAENSGCTAHAFDAAASACQLGVRTATSGVGSEKVFMDTSTTTSTTTATSASTTTTASTVTSANCPSAEAVSQGYELINGKWYLYHPSTVFYDDAKQICADAGARLAKIDNADDWNAIAQMPIVQEVTNYLFWVDAYVEPTNNTICVARAGSTFDDCYGVLKWGNGEEIRWTQNDLDTWTPAQVRTSTAEMCMGIFDLELHDFFCEEIITSEEANSGEETDASYEPRPICQIEC